MREDIFSPTEVEVLKALGRRKMKIIDVTKKVFRGKKPPIGANNSIAAMIRRINSKCEYHKLPWFLNGMGSGRHGRTVWRDKNQCRRLS